MSTLWSSTSIIYFYVAINIELIFNRCFTEAQRALSESSEKKDDRLEPLDQSIVASSSDKDKDQWYDIGLQLISNGKVGVLLLAGKKLIIIIYHNRY